MITYFLKWFSNKNGCYLLLYVLYIKLVKESLPPTHQTKLVALLQQRISLKKHFSPLATNLNQRDKKCDLQFANYEKMKKIKQYSFISNEMEYHFKSVAAVNSTAKFNEQQIKKTNKQSLKRYHNYRIHLSSVFFSPRNSCSTVRGDLRKFVRCFVFVFYDHWI